MGGKYIDLSLFNEELKTLINSAAKIFPMAYEDIIANINPNGYEYARVMDGEHKREIYHWDGAEWGLIGADDIDINWSDIKEKPVVFTPAQHQHIEAEISDLDKYTQAQIDTLLTGKADAEHTHNELHSHDNKSVLDIITQMLIDAWNSAVDHISDAIKHITGEERTLWNTVADKADTTYVDAGLALKASLTHDHDGRYYTEGEVDTKLSQKADVFANRTVLDKITEQLSYQEYDLSMLYDLDDRLYAIENGYSEGHSHTNLAVLNLLDYSGELLLVDLKQIEDNTTAIAGKADAGHGHSMGDITGLNTALDGKSNIGHGHTKSEISDFAHGHTEADITNLDKYSQAEVNSLVAAKADTTYVDTQLSVKVDKTTFDGHKDNTTIHVTQTDKDGWSSKVRITQGTSQPTDGSDFWFKEI